MVQVYQLYINTFALGLVELDVVLTGSLLRAVQVPLGGIPSHPCLPQLAVTSKPAEGGLHPGWGTEEDIK